MRAKKKQQENVIYTSETPTLAFEINGGRVSFRSFFALDLAQAVRLNVISCNFRVLLQQNPKSRDKKFTAAGSKSAINSSTIEKLRSLQKAPNVIFEGSVDVTKQIPNDRVFAISRGASIRRQKTLKFKSSNELNPQAGIKPSSAASSLGRGAIANRDDSQSLRVDMLYRRHIDPADLVNKVRFFAPTKNGLSGLKLVDSAISKADSKQLQFRNSLSKGTSGKQVQAYIEEKEITLIDVPLLFNVSKRGLSEVRVEIDAVTSSGANDQTRTLQTVSFNLNLRELYEDFIIPIESPSCDFASYGTYRVINARQVDRNASRLKIYRKLIDGGSNSSFDQISDLPARFGSSVRFIDRPNSLAGCIYRVVPFNELGITSGQFTSFVQTGLGYNKRYQTDTTSVLAYENNSIVEIKAFNIPNDVISVRLVRKNLTVHETKFTVPSSVITASSLKLDRKTKEVSFKDQPTRANLTLEYCLILIDAYGNERISQNSCVTRFVNDKNTAGRQGITVSAPQTTSAGARQVSFNLDASADDSSLDKIYSIVEASGLSTAYVNELKGNRELLSGIIAFEIFRFDPVTGLNECFGIIPAGTFVDSSETRRSKNVSELVAGRTYHYHYRLLVRSVSTVFSGIQIPQINQQTGNTFQTDMKKFNSPNVSKRGTMASTFEQQRIDAKTGLSTPAYASSDSEMIQGATSFTGLSIVKIEGADTQFSNFKVSKGSKGNIIKWQIKSGVQIIDHIIIYADYNRKIAPIKALQYCDIGNMSYVDNTFDAPLENMNYYISAVFSDLSESEPFGPAKVA